IAAPPAAFGRRRAVRPRTVSRGYNFIATSDAHQTRPTDSNPSDERIDDTFVSIAGSPHLTTEPIPRSDGLVRAARACCAGPLLDVTPAGESRHEHVLDAFQTRSPPSWLLAGHLCPSAPKNPYSHDDHRALAPH